MIRQKIRNNLNRLALLKTFNPTLIRLCFGRNNHTENDTNHLALAIKWLCHAQDACQGNGCASHYNLLTGWATLAYPETTGYIIETFLNADQLFPDDNLKKRAIQLGQWESKIQHGSGGICSDLSKAQQLRVFNTAQVIHGWISLYEKTGDKLFLDSAIKAAKYISSKQDPSGYWEKDTYCGKQTYDTRVSWALLRVYKHSNKEYLFSTAIKNISWVLKQQESNGFFNHCGFDGLPPITHLIGYTLRGLLESSNLLEGNVDNNFTESISKTLELSLGAIYQSHCSGASSKGRLPASYLPNWQPHQTSSCLTGNAQLAIIFHLFSKKINKPGYMTLSNELLGFLHETLYTYDNNGATIGAIPGSHPIYKDYCANMLPNWATKFYADLILLKEHQS